MYVFDACECVRRMLLPVRRARKHVRSRLRADLRAGASALPAAATTEAHCTEEVTHALSIIGRLHVRAACTQTRRGCMSCVGH